MEFSSNQRQANCRRGLSFVEFVGCLVAMIGGVLIGSFYLGLDAQKVALGVLEQAQVVAPGYFSQFTATQLVGDTPATAKNQESSTTQELAAVDSTTIAESTPTTDSIARLLHVKPEPSAAERQQATRAYWDQLTAIMLKEVQDRIPDGGNPEEWKLYDYLSQRKRGHEQALAQLETLDDLSVDERLLDHGEQVVAWHKAGVKKFAEALSLLSDVPGAKFTGPFAKRWQTSVTQLRMEESLVVERHKAIASYLDREYTAAAPFVPAFQPR